MRRSRRYSAILLEEAIIVSLVIIVFLFHFRSALIAILALPIAVLVSFIPMYWLGVTSNIMSLGGIALAIGVLVDASIVMVENGYRHLSERQENDANPVSEPERQTILINAAKQVGPALFFSLLIIVVSFLPVFLLEAQEGRMFRPLAWTKTLAVGSSSILAITLVPVLMVMLIRGRLRPERANPISRITQAIYLPILKFCLRHRWLTIAVNLIFLIVTFPLASRLGSQFMPPLFEGSTLYMPTALPGISIEQAKVLLQQQDRILRSFPEVASVFGAVGRSDSATDNAPLDMYDTTVMLKPREQWPAGMTYEKLIQQMDEKLQFPGLSNTWTMPVENRLDMELTGIKTPLGMKVQGPNVDGIQQLASQIQNCPLWTAAGAVCLCGEGCARLLRQCRCQPGGGRPLWPHDRGCSDGGFIRHRWAEYCREHRRPRTLSHQCPLSERLPRQCRADARSADRHSIGRADSARAGGADLLHTWPCHDSGRRWRADRIHLHRSQKHRLRRLRCEMRTSSFTTNWLCQPTTPFSGRESTNSNCAPSSGCN